MVLLLVLLWTEAPQARMKPVEVEMLPWEALLPLWRALPSVVADQWEPPKDWLRPPAVPLPLADPLAIEMPVVVQAVA